MWIVAPILFCSGAAAAKVALSLFVFYGGGEVREGGFAPLGLALLPCGLDMGRGCIHIYILTYIDISQGPNH